MDSPLGHKKEGKKGNLISTKKFLDEEDDAVPVLKRRMESSN
jgi:hypothetical protein